jgi:hypothetical protein
MDGGGCVIFSAYRVNPFVTPDVYRGATFFFLNFAHRWIRICLFTFETSHAALD